MLSCCIQSISVVVCVPHWPLPLMAQTQHNSVASFDRSSYTQHQNMADPASETAREIIPGAEHPCCQA